MEKRCGYVGLDGKFYETEEECNRADIKYRCDTVRNSLRELPEFLLNSMWGDEERKKFKYVEETVLTKVCKYILEEGDFFVHLIENKKAYKEELEKALQEAEELNRPWYLKIKWW